MSRYVTHRWNAPDDGRSPGDRLPGPGDVVAGRRDHWRVMEVLPVESVKYPNAWRARLQPLGPHGLDAVALDRKGQASWWIYVPPDEDPK